MQSRIDFRQTALSTVINRGVQEEVQGTLETPSEIVLIHERNGQIVDPDIVRSGSGFIPVVRRYNP